MEAQLHFACYLLILKMSMKMKKASSQANFEYLLPFLRIEEQAWRQ